jgi:tetratricopeptide (TPR) repeat protein
MVTEEKILHRDAGEMVVITQYIQDLYRFFKLHPFRDDFRDIFDMPWELSGNVLFRLFSASDETCRKAGEFLFEKEHYPQVVPYFRHLVANWNPDQALIEKLGYCYQMMGQYETALGYFKQAELFDTNRLWSIKKIIYCYRQLKDYDSALHWCLEAEKLAADDVYVLTMTGNCYLDLKQVDQALEQYFKVEFMAPDNKKVMKPIAWCSLVLGKLEIARNYASAILAEDPTAHDYMHAGHVEYCLGNKLKAMEYYKASMSMGVISLPKFIEMLEADTEYLLANGMDFREIQFIADYLRYQ